MLDEAADLMQLADSSDRAERPPTTDRSASYTEENLRPVGHPSAPGRSGGVAGPDFNL
ncbi:MAG TPA: hypothetical protein VGS06_02830 [Streptosporangiaceae bacterium]|nr:hypothetical protein [Streptosporangiaceae bacterium]